MLVIFKSSASGNVITFEKNAMEILDALGKDSSERKGIFTVEQLPESIMKLKLAIDNDIAACRIKDRHKQSQSSEDESGADEEFVSFHQRALPVLELLERSLNDQVPVTWGV